MSETAPEKLETLSGSVLTERRRALIQELQGLNDILHSRMRGKVEDVLRKRGVELQIYGCRGNRLFLMANQNVRTAQGLISDETIRAIKDDLRATGCIADIGLTIDEQYGFTQTIDFNPEKLDADIPSGEKPQSEIKEIGEVVDETRRNLK